MKALHLPAYDSYAHGRRVQSLAEIGLKAQNGAPLKTAGFFVFVVLLALVFKGNSGILSLEAPPMKR